MEATWQAVRATIERLTEGHGLSREEAYALCNVAVAFCASTRWWARPTGSSGRSFPTTSFAPPGDEMSDRTGAPVNALAVVMVIAIVAFVSQRMGGVSAVNAFFYPGTVGVLSMLVAYIVTNVGALRFLFLSRRVRAWEAIVPVIALAILVYVIYANVYPVPDFPFDVFPYVVATWLILGLGIVLFVPGLARRIGANLAEREGLADEESPRS